MKREETRQILIDGTIRVIAREGLDSASTKLIGLETNMNQAYIYRCFEDKEDMFAKVFSYLDNEFFSTAMDHIDVMYDQSLDFETRCRRYFNAMWQFLVGNRDKCLTYIQYYYSPYFTNFSVEEHKKRFTPLVNRFSDAFRAQANVWMLLNHILNVMLDFAVKVHNNQMPDGDNYVEHIFRVIYASLQQYFK